jgi:hypothetical protein
VCSSDLFGCDQPVCIRKCPYGLPVKDMLSDAHRTMTFVV